MMGSMMRRAMLGDGSTLSLDFTTGVLDPLLTFTRSTSGTYIGADGLVKTATANTPRFDFDATAIGTPRGLLIEGSANNLCLNSEDFSAWNTANTSLASESGDTNPDGITVPTRVSDNSTNGEHYRGRTPSLTTATTYTKSAWFKNPATNGRRYGGLQLFAGGGTDTGGVVAVWDFDTGQSVSSLTFGYGGKPTPSVSCVPYKSGWYRVSISMTVTGTLTALNHRILLSNGTATSYANSGTALGLLVWGAQLETNSGASSYIPTGASQGSRAADSCVMTGTNFSSWFNATEGTFLAHARRIWTSDVGRIASANDNTASESIDIGASTTGQFIVTDGGSALATITPGTVTANTAFKIAGAFKLNDVQAALGGTLGTADSSVTMPTVNQLMIGQQAGASPVYLNGTVSMLKFWPTRLPNDQLQALTT